MCVSRNINKLFSIKPHAKIHFHSTLFVLIWEWTFCSLEWPWLCPFVFRLFDAVFAVKSFVRFQFPPRQFGLNSRANTNEIQELLCGITLLIETWLPKPHWWNWFVYDWSKKAIKIDLITLQLFIVCCGICVCKDHIIRILFNWLILVIMHETVCTRVSWK